jgi:adenylate cyclase
MFVENKCGSNKQLTESKNRLQSLLDEIRRRKVVRVVVAYLLVGWGLIQVADATIEPLHLPEWAGTLVVWLVALGFPIAVVLAWVLDITPEGIKVTETSDNEPDASEQDLDQSIAVLPFVNVSGDPDNEYFSDGLSEELLNLLVRLRSLRVCSRTTSFALKGQNLDMQTVASQLGVQHVLEGSVRRVEDRVRISAQLINARDDRHLWSETYDRELKDIFAVQQEIAMQIFDALKLSLSPDERRAMLATTDSAAAFDLYLRGRDQYHRTEPGHLEKSRDRFEQAIRIDPEYALAWAGLTYVFIEIYWYKENDAAWLERAHEASRKAVQLAPHLAESHTARGLALRADEQFDEAESEFEQAIEINPRLFEPLHFYAQMERSRGNFARASELFVQAAKVRPEDYQAMAIASQMFEAMEDEEKAKESARETVDRVNSAIILNPKDSRALILGATALYTLGDTQRALDFAHMAREAYPEGSGVMYNTACIYAKLGRHEEAIDLLEKAVEGGARNKRYYETDTDFDSIRDHPRFKALMNRI